MTSFINILLLLITIKTDVLSTVLLSSWIRASELYFACAPHKYTSLCAYASHYTMTSINFKYIFEFSFSFAEFSFYLALLLSLSLFSHTHTCPANVIFLSEQTQFIWFVVARVQCFIQQPFLRIYIFPTTAFFRFTLGCRNLLARNCCFAAVMISLSRHSDYIANSFKQNFFRRGKKL